MDNTFSLLLPCAPRRGTGIPYLLEYNVAYTSSPSRTGHRSAQPLLRSYWITRVVHSSWPATNVKSNLQFYAISADVVAAV